jgi:radical SAM superfamily enzyme YgiQ (UPF0313 family)
VPELIKWSEQNGFPFSFTTEASINLAEDDLLLEMMQRAGFERVFLGIETPVEASLKEAGKSQNTRRDLLESVAKIQSYGMEVMAGLIVGFDSDPEDIFDLQIDFIRASAIPLAMVGLLTALPETQLWRRLEKEGRLLEESSGNNVDASLNFIPNMDAVKLTAGYKQVLSTIYSPKEYYGRALDCLGRVKHVVLTQKHGHFLNEAKSFVRLILKLGIFDRERNEFWKYMAQVVAKHRQSFAHAMVLAAMGYHFRLLTEEIAE